MVNSLYPLISLFHKVAEIGNLVAVQEEAPDPQGEHRIQVQILEVVAHQPRESLIEERYC